MKALSLLIPGHPKQSLRTLRSHKKEEQKVMSTFPVIVKESGWVLGGIYP